MEGKQAESSVLMVWPTIPAKPKVSKYINIILFYLLEKLKTCPNFE
jgi:hypothetical protein